MKNFLCSFLALICCGSLFAENFGTPVKYDLIKIKGGSRALEIAKVYLYSAGGKDLSVFDISNPAKPKLVYVKN